MAQDTVAERSEEIKSYREKYWEECSIEEKIERTRDQVKNLQSVIDRALGQIELLNEHSHQEGKLTVPLGFRFDVKPTSLRRDRGKKEVYF